MGGNGSKDQVIGQKIGCFGQISESVSTAFAILTGILFETTW